MMTGKHIWMAVIIAIAFVATVALGIVGNSRTDEKRLTAYETCVEAGGVPVEGGRTCVWGKN